MNNNWFPVFIFVWLIFTAVVIAIKLVGKARRFIERMPKPASPLTLQRNATFASTAKNVIGLAGAAGILLVITVIVFAFMPRIGFALSFWDLLLIWIIVRSSR